MIKEYLSAASNHRDVICIPTTLVYILPRTHAQGVKQLTYPSVVIVVVVVVGMKIARSQDIGFIESDKCHQTVRIIFKTMGSLLLNAKQGS